MWEKLAKRTKPNVETTPEATQSPQAKVSLQWNPPMWTSPHGAAGSGYQESQCGLFSISKDAHELGFSYTAWKRDTKPPTNLGCKRTSDEAKALCEPAR